METLTTPSSNGSIAVMGDINLDWHVRGNLGFPFSSLVENGVIVWAPIEEVPGGSGINFANFAKQAGYDPVVMGKIGNDAAGRQIEEWLDQKGIRHSLSHADQGTGKAVIVRDSRDIRFLVNNDDNANHVYSEEDVSNNAVLLLSCDILYVSGYCIMYPNALRSSAIVKAMDLASARSKRMVAVFDVVPHHVYKILTFDEFRSVTRHVDMLISEVATIRRFLKEGDRNEIIDRNMAIETAQELKEHYTFFVLRFGPTGCDHQMTWNVTNGKLELLEDIDTGHSEVSDKRGFGDLLAIRTLTNFLPYINVG